MTTRIPRILAQLRRPSTLGVGRMALALCLILILTALFPRGNTHTFEYSEGSIWIEGDLIAPMDFPIYQDPLEVERKRKVAFENTVPSFDRIEGTEDEVQNLIGIMSVEFRRFQQDLSSRSGRNVSRELSLADTLRRRFRQRGLTPPLKDEQWTTLAVQVTRSPDAAPRLPIAHLEDLCRQLAREMYRSGYLDHLKSSLHRPTIVIPRNGVEEPYPVDRFLDRSDVERLLRTRLLSDPQLPPESIPALVDFSLWMIRPNVRFNAQRTEIAKEAAVDAVPTTLGIIKRNERIVARHQRVTHEVKAKLDSYQQAMNERIGTTEMLLRSIGKAGHVTALLGLLVLYLVFFRKKIFASLSRLTLIGTVILFVAGMAWLSFTIKTELPLEYLILVPIASMVLTIVFDSRVAFYGTVVASLLAGAIRGNDYGVILSSLLGGALALYTVRDIKHRTQMFRSLAFIFLGYSFAIGVDALQRLVPLSEVSISIGFAFVNAVLSPVITYGILIFFERFFSISTDLTLLELSDFNHPLLQRLSQKAPGTFHHSVVMGTLAETAATAIGANAILARVGAYYHDIGKMRDISLFVENQRGESNPHETMEPTHSAQLIIEHVRTGIEEARRARLPERIVRFIPTHHGTTTASYFYEKARQHNPDVDRAQFRYPGPRPQTKEEGIVMLADGIEAAVRALDEPTRENIEKVVDGFVAKRVAEGELDECSLTIQDLSEIKKAFTNILEGIHHSRIKYPGEEGAEESTAAERTALLLKLPPMAEALARRVKKITDS